MSFEKCGLRFREVDPNDLPFLRDLRNTQWSGYRDPTSIQTSYEQEKWYQSLNRDNQAFMVEEPHGGPTVPVGLLRFGNFDRVNRAVTITGVDVFPDARGRGIATGVMRAAAEYMLHDLGMHRIVGECTAGNVAMKRAMEKAGYIMEGCKRSYIWRSGVWHDFLQYSLLAEELWPEDAAQPAGGL